jgi:adenine-specific DNA-methyltransferase
MAALHQELAPETWKVVFKDNGFVTDSAKVNVKEILKCAGLDEDAFTTV